MEKYFKLKENGTNVKQEFIAALVTFSSMVYMLMVSVNMYSNPFGNGENVLGLPYGAIYRNSISCIYRLYADGINSEIACGTG